MKGEQVRQNIANLPVVCAWCGVIIRHTNKKASYGMCLDCFGRMMSEHNRPYQQAQHQTNASER